MYVNNTHKTQTPFPKCIHTQDLENCRLPEKEDVCELVRRIKSMFVDPKSPQKLLGFVVGISHTVKLGKQAQDLRYSGVQMRRCLGKWAGKNEEAESYLISVRMPVCLCVFEGGGA